MFKVRKKPGPRLKVVSIDPAKILPPQLEKRFAEVVERTRAGKVRDVVVLVGQRSGWSLHTFTLSKTGYHLLGLMDVAMAEMRSWEREERR